MQSKRLLVIAVVISVALNLLLAGVILGRLAGPGPEMHRLDPMMGLRRLLSDLPDERAAALAPYYREYFSTLRPRFRELRSTQQDLRAAMLTEPLDREAVQSALAAFRQDLYNSQGAAHDAFVALAAELTLAERRQLVTFMSRRPPGGARPSPGAEPHHALPGPPPP